MSPDWLTRALCRYEGHPTWWDLEVDGERTPQTERRHSAAIAVCQRCPVIEECRAARDPRRDFGVWAGEVHDGMVRAGTRQHLDLPGKPRKNRRTT